MADINSKFEIGVTTGPIRGSQKIHVGPLRVAMRQINLEPSCGEAPVNVYDASGPYTDPDALIDISAGLPELRREVLRPAPSPGRLPEVYDQLRSGRRNRSRQAWPCTRERARSGQSCAAARTAGVTKLFRMGGAQAVAAMA